MRPAEATDAPAAVLSSVATRQCDQQLQRRFTVEGTLTCWQTDAGVRGNAQALVFPLGVAVAIAAAVLQGCTHVEYLDPKSAADTQSIAHPLKPREIAHLPNPDAAPPQRAVVLLRLAVKYEGKSIESPFSIHLYRPWFSGRYLRISSQDHGVTLLNVGYASSESRRAGWFWLSLEPGNYDLTFAAQNGQLGPNVTSAGFQKQLILSPEKQLPMGPALWGPFRIQVPRDVKLVYAGTLALDCDEGKDIDLWTRWGLAIHYSCDSEQILDEGDLARQVAAASLARFGPPTTALLAPAREADALLAQARAVTRSGYLQASSSATPSDYAMPSCATKPSPDTLGQVLGVFVDWRRQEQLNTGNGKQDPKLDEQATEAKLVGCFRDALHKAAPKLTPVGMSARLDRGDGSTNTLREMNTAIVTRLRDAQQRGEFKDLGMRYLVAVQALTDQGLVPGRRDVSPQGIELSSKRRTSTSVDVLIIDIQEGCLLEEQALRAVSDAETGVGLVAFVLPVPYYVPSGNTEAKACEALAQRVANTLSEKR